MKNIRIATITTRAVVGDIEGNLARAAYWSRQAKAAGAALVCFPELSVTGYALGKEMAALAQPIPGPITTYLDKVARETRTIILAGLVEANPCGRPFVSHCLIRPDGELSVYRKLYLSPREKPFFQAGDTVSIFDVDGIGIGIQLCYDGHFPELTTAMTEAGAHVIFLPHASPRGDAKTKHLSWMRHMPARAYDNSIFIVACNQWGDNQRGLIFPGNAVAIDPSGNILNKKISGDEAMIVADLCAKVMADVREHPMRFFFPNRRSELYK